MQRMPLLYPHRQTKKPDNKRSQRWIIVGACLLLVVSAILLYVIVTGLTRSGKPDPFVPTTPNAPATSTQQKAARRLDGVLVDPGFESKRPISVMIDNQIDAQPWSGVDRASLVIESPVEGGITRLMAFFDPSVSSSTMIGPVRSARPYFVDWARAWEAGYAHVGGSPEALDKLKRSSEVANLDEMAHSNAFYRLRAKVAPHNVYTSIDLLSEVMDRRYGTSTATFAPWRFEPLATSTNAVVSAASVRILYGGSYSVTWKYDAELGLYRRFKGAAIQKTAEGKELLVANVVVIKTDSQVLDKEGRLSLRTVGSGDAMLYRSGKKYIARWSRSQNEPMRFEGADGSEYPMTAGMTWIEVTTDDRVFAGLPSS